MKKVISIVLMVCVCISLTGCDIKANSMEDINIYTTNYPTEYITQRLYGDHATVSSIYPNGVNINEYKLTKKQIDDYSKGDLYIFNGLSETEKGYVTSFRKKNNNLKIIDTTLYMEYENDISELWLDPSNFLMMAQNIKKGFKEYINNYYLNEDINNNYTDLKLETSNLDAKIKQTIKNASNPVIVTSSSMFKYLEKYGLTVYSLEENDSLTDKTIQDVKKLIKNKEISYIIVKEDEEVNDTIKSLIDNTDIKTLEWHTLSNITETQKNESQDYFTLMNENIDILKEELY